MKDKYGWTDISKYGNPPDDAYGVYRVYASHGQDFCLWMGQWEGKLKNITHWKEKGKDPVGVK